MGLTINTHRSDIKLKRGECVLATAPLAYVALRDDRAVCAWLPKIQLDHYVVRELAARLTTPVAKFHNVRICGVDYLDTVSMVWGDFQLYEVGMTVITDFCAVPDKFTGSPPGTLIAQALRHLKVMKEKACK